MPAATTDARRTDGEPIPRRRLWLGLYLAPLAWMVAFAVGYVLVARSCEGDNGMHARGIPGFRWVDLIVALVMAALAAYGLTVAFASLRTAQRASPSTDYDAEIAAGAEDPASRAEAPWWGRELFMARAGVIGSAIFLVATLLFVIPPLLLDACSQAR